MDLRSVCLLLLCALCIAIHPSPTYAKEGTQNVISPPAYTLGVGDKIRVTVFGEELLSGDFTVGGNGNVSLPLIGDVRAAERTIGEFQDDIKESLVRGYLKEPRVSAEVLTYRPYYILGEVHTPGQYPYSIGLTILNAVATAGGFTYRADTDDVYVKMANEPAEKKYRLNEAMPIFPGATIRIRERHF